MSYYELAEELAEIKQKMHCLFEYKKMNLANCGESVLLSFLKKHNNSQTPTQLSEALGVSTARVAALLNRMEKKGLVERRKHPDNNRNVMVYLLPEGERVSAEQEETFNRRVVSFFETLGEKDAEQFVKYQRKMLEFILEIDDRRED